MEDGEQLAIGGVVDLEGQAFFQGAVVAQRGREGGIDASAEQNHGRHADHSEGDEKRSQALRMAVEGECGSFGEGFAQEQDEDEGEIEEGDWSGSAAQTAEAGTGLLAVTREIEVGETEDGEAGQRGQPNASGIQSRQEPEAKEEFGFDKSRLKPARAPEFRREDDSLRRQGVGFPDAGSQQQHAHNGKDRPKRQKPNSRECHGGAPFVRQGDSYGKTKMSIRYGS